VINRTADMMLEMGNRPPITEEVLAKVQIPVTCLRGEKDAMVNHDETLWAAKYLINSKSEEIPGWLHPIDKIPTNELVEQIENHFN